MDDLFEQRDEDAPEAESPQPEVSDPTPAAEAEEAAEAHEEAPVSADASDREQAEEILGSEVPEAEVETPGAEPVEQPQEPEQPPAVEAAEEPAPEQPEEETVEGPEEGPEEGPGDPFAPPGDWYVIHTYAGYENKVKTNLQSRIQTMQMQDKIFDVVIPMEDVMEIKGGRKQVVEKKVFPGYLLVKMEYDDDSWYVVRNTPGVTGFVSSGTGQKPTSLSRREVEKILSVKKEEAKPQFRLEFEEGDVVRIISGPFADFNGTISEINVDQSKVKVMVNIFDRETPVELSFDQVARV
jgi:transcription termination/antitermination protein NusG